MFTLGALSEPSGAPRSAPAPSALLLLLAVTQPMVATTQRSALGPQLPSNGRNSLEEFLPDALLPNARERLVLPRCFVT